MPSRPNIPPFVHPVRFHQRGGCDGRAAAYRNAGPEMRRLLIPIALLFLCGAAIRWLKPRSVRAAANVNITVDLTLRYQTLEGFGQAEPSSLYYPPNPPAMSDALRAVAIDKAFHQVGINMGTIGALLESPGTYDQRQNDNSDPFNTNWAGFNADALVGVKKYLIDLAKPYGFT